jgi:hypothetical protein
MARRLFLVVWLAVALTAATTHAGTHKAGPHFQVLAHVNPPGGYSADVVGERHYAYLSSHRGTNDCPAQGVRVYDLSNPRKPRHISTFADAKHEPILDATWTEKTIVRHVNVGGFKGDLAVTSIQACSSGFGGFALYDVTRPAHPKRLSIVRTDPRGSHEIWLGAARGHVWVYTALAAAEFEATPDSFGFHIYDVTNPRRPQEVGGWSACKELKLCTPMSGNTGTRALVHSVITNAAQTRAYLSYWDDGTVILDISDPSHPRYLGRTPRGQGRTHSAWLTHGGKILVETHETAHGRPYVYDISNPAHPVRLAIVRLPSSLHSAGTFSGGLPLDDSVHDPKIAGNLVYFSWYAQGVPVFDLTNPSKPRYLTRFRPPPVRDGHGLLCPGHSCAAVWGVFPTPKYVLASDLSSGLWVLRLRR